MLDTLKNINPDQIKDKETKSMFIILLNLAENQQSAILELKEVNQQLRDEINRLKGEQGKPKFSSSKKSEDISSNHPRKNKGRKGKKQGKKKDIPIDEKVSCPIAKTTLPFDAVFKGYTTVIQQDLVFQRKNTEFQIELWYSPSGKKTYRSPSPDYTGYFGNDLKTFVLMMHN